MAEGAIFIVRDDGFVCDYDMIEVEINGRFR